MDFKNILQYQKKDAELIKLEKEVNSNDICGKGRTK